MRESSILVIIEQHRERTHSNRKTNDYFEPQRHDYHCQVHVSNSVLDISLAFAINRQSSDTRGRNPVVPTIGDALKKTISKVLAHCLNHV